MPIYEFSCQCGNKFDRYLTIDHYKDEQDCECGKVATKMISRPMIFIAPDVCYDSPIDGRPITSMAARREDLARSGCVPYDPDLKQDYHRRIDSEEKALEKSFSNTINSEIAKMPARKREKLEAEMSAGMDVNVGRGAAPISTIMETQNG